MRISDWSSDVCSSDLWSLPLLCRRGHVTKHEIGAIRIGPSETLFNIPLAIADRFAEAVQRSANADGEDDSGVAIIPPPDGAAYPPRREKAPRKGGKPLHRKRARLHSSHSCATRMPSSA